MHHFDARRLLFGLLVVVLAWGLAAPVLAAPSDGAASAVAPDSTPTGEEGAATQPPEASEQSAASLTGQPALPPLEPVYSQPAYLALPGGTTVVPESFYSPTLDRTVPYEVILPPGYADGSASYPVLYMLHGYGGWSHSWIELGLHQTADYLWSEGSLPPFIVVLPEGGNSYFMNHADDGVRWGDYVAEDMVRQVDLTYRTRPEARFRAIGGLSMGGDGALQLALRHPDVFGVVGAFSPTTRLSYDQAPGPFYGDEAYWQQNNPLWLIEHGDSAAWLRIWIGVGRSDAWEPSARALHEALVEHGIFHQYVEWDGGHDAEGWIASSPAYLRFCAEAFEDGGPAMADTTGSAPGAW